MGNVICRLCGAEADSKCPACRTVFPEDQYEAAVSYSLKFSIKEKNGLNWLDVSYFLGDGKNKDDVEWGLRQLLGTLQRLDLKRYACHHEWVMKDGCYSRIGCGHYAEV